MHTIAAGMIAGMDADEPERDQRWDGATGSETEGQRLDRYWASLLQELRVVQTGVQLLTGFLLTLPFQQRFNILDTTMRTTYLATVACSVGATVLFIAPVRMHRLLFRRHRLGSVVSAAHRLTYTGLLLLGLALIGVTVVVFDAVAGQLAAIIAGVVAAIALVALWVGLPAWMRISGARPPGR